MLTVISNLLTALAQLLKQNHLLAKDYQKHLLYERLQGGIDEDIDRIKEIALACDYPESIANAEDSLYNAAEVVEEITDIETLEKEIIKTINKAIAKISKTDDFAKEAITNMLGDIAEKRLRDLYLLKIGGAK